MTDQHEGIQQDDGRQVPGEIGSVRRAYVTPELIAYGSVSKLTQGNVGSFTDAGAMMTMGACL